MWSANKNHLSYFNYLRSGALRHLPSSVPCVGETFLLSRAICPDVLLSMGLVVGVPLAGVSNPYTGGWPVDLFCTDGTPLVVCFLITTGTCYLHFFAHFHIIGASWSL